MLEPNPRVILVPGIGLFTTGKDRRTSRIAHDLYLHTMRVIADASSIDKNLNAYAITRNLLKVKVTAQDVADAVLFVAADRSAKTTGTKIPVDEGNKEAFPR